MKADSEECSSSDTDVSKSGDKRERWSSRTAFIFAAVGSAIGIGNVWRFPSLCFKFGGGAFFFPYLLSLFFLGIPLLILEVGLGQSYQGGDAVVFGKMHPRLRAVGLASVWASFVYVGYFCVMIGWFVRMLIYSFYSPQPWAGDEFRYNTKGSFAWAIEGILEANTERSAVPTELSAVNVAIFAFVWLSVWGSLFFGIKATGKLTYFTMGLPVVIILAMLVRGLTLPNASYGLVEYIGRWDMSVLITSPSVWSEACAQIFVSIGVTYGMMTAYASYNKSKENVNTNSWIVALCNSGYSITAGFAVFSALGNMCYFQSEKFVDGAMSHLGDAPLTYDSILPDTENYLGWPYGGFGLPFWKSTDPRDRDAEAKKKFDQKEYQLWFQETTNGCSNKKAGDCKASPWCVYKAMQSASGNGATVSKCVLNDCGNKSDTECTDAPYCTLSSSSSCISADCTSQSMQQEYNCESQAQCSWDTSTASCGDRVIESWSVNGTPLVPMRNLAVNGPGLVFGAYPVVLSSLPGAQFFSVAFFFAMYLLGVNSAFSFLEAGITVVLDTRAFHAYSRRSVVTFASMVGFIISIAYAHDAGFNLMETIDFYINVVMLFVGICETCAACWIFRLQETIAVCGALPTFLLFGSVILSSLVTGITGFIGGNTLAAIPLGLLIFITFFVASLYLLQTRGTTELNYKTKLRELLLGNVEYLRFRFNRGCMDDLSQAKWYQLIPITWSINIKYFAPPVLILLWFNILVAETTNDEGERVSQFGNFNDFALGYQIIGIFTAMFSVVLVVVGIAFPKVFSCLEHQSSNEEPAYMDEYHAIHRVKKAEHEGGFQKAELEGVVAAA